MLTVHLFCAIVLFLYIFPGTLQSCPCWTQSELNGVTADNVDPGSCAYTDQTEVLYLSSGSNQSFAASLSGASGYCLGPHNSNPNTLTEEPAESCIQQIKNRCAQINHPVTSATSATQGEMKTFEQQVSVAQDKNTRASGHAESKSNTELPECSTLGIAGTPEGCQQYCTENSLGSSNFSETNNSGATGMISTCGCTQDGTTTNVCIKSPPGPNTEGKSCTDLSITDNQSCTDYCNGFGEWDTTTDGKVTSSSCTCGTFYCTSALGTSSSSALSLLLPGAVVTVTTYLITMGI